MTIDVTYENKRGLLGILPGVAHYGSVTCKFTHAHEILSEVDAMSRQELTALTSKILECMRRFRQAACTARYDCANSEISKSSRDKLIRIYTQQFELDQELLQRVANLLSQKPIRVKKERLE